MIRWFKYVPHDRVMDYLLAGWVYAADLGQTHGTYSTLMEWTLSEEPVLP